MSIYGNIRNMGATPTTNSGALVCIARLELGIEMSELPFQDPRVVSMRRVEASVGEGSIVKVYCGSSSSGCERGCGLLRINRHGF